jgi:hypothetical protein
LKETTKRNIKLEEDYDGMGVWTPILMDLGQCSPTQTYTSHAHYNQTCMSTLVHVANTSLVEHPPKMQQ